MHSPLPLLLLALAITGLALSLASGGMLQPDWSLAILLGALLARRGTWPWVLPALLLHDLALYWTPWGVFPLACLLPILLQRMDAQLGPGLPQRMGMLLLVSMPMLFYGAGLMQWSLTLLLCIPVWHSLAYMYDRQIA
ncbi:MAG: hypothetical protein COW19_05925 [Zetaproteobacteria bacterium CG12_big_fil_rev_8_21_14_0_65_55_1124]|nr:MAG: hypothetical protein AUJ58_05800 [Zetaproteobacteria bacterium CG1_02_55_237]PIS19782.1 MAG: hypothetical protein COT53_03605 [Zetaproteobacteria bacterium CG08_land_8_20_14_0_20_55_17]PIW42817.1 MAG: hypothetical protein COW19_05925 [Zetaproteobacteria bacterium CG12_big_fil_rev_8_21_14_0_65_55_1124]PIY51629.1 MAG: hypothetical protein COZ01_10295 [Zetaproteobacteria bacterium CG_4_10_14_0_8_um_filter_55_43]PIZ39802.1 MAG: hypothetical protein COY36_01695 [Zetaproteobacteria bacterium 